MGEAEYRRLKEQSKAAGLSANAWLIRGEPIRVRLTRFGLNPYSGVNHICSNIRQIARCPRGRELAPDAVEQLEFLAGLLCEEIYLLDRQERPL